MPLPSVENGKLQALTGWLLIHSAGIVGFVITLQNETTEEKQIRRGPDAMRKIAIISHDTNIVIHREIN